MLATAVGRITVIVLRWALGALFVYAGIAKAIDSSGFIADLGRYHLIPEFLLAPVAIYLPFLEILAGAALITGFLSAGGLVSITGMLLAFSVGLASAWWRGLDITCRCFGSGWGDMSVQWALSRNSLLLAICLTLAFPVLRSREPFGVKVGALIPERLKSWRTFVLLCIGIFYLAWGQEARAFTITAETLKFESHVDEPVVLTLDVDLGKESSSIVDITVDGFFCDRKVYNMGGGRHRIEIAPETPVAGPVRGKVQVQVNGSASGYPVPVSGKVRPWISMQPSRIFLGSIGHGERFEESKTWEVSLDSDTEPFDIKSVELPDIVGASWRCEPKEGIPAKKKILSFTFSPSAVAAGLPYGALARKFATVKTSHPEASVLSIPITGMISVNTTDRDYSTFLYKGQLRWQGPWSTPNVAAAFLSMATLLLCGIGAALHKNLRDLEKSCKISNETERKSKQQNTLVELQEERPGRRRFPFLSLFPAIATMQWVIMATIFPGMALGCFFLAKTYSRGGWAAMAAGIAVLILGTRRMRFYPLVLAGLFAVMIAGNPAGISRAASSGAVEADKSIANRLLLWEGALQMMAEHPWKGVGAGKFGEAFMRDYQRPTHTQSYSTAINDFLTLGTEHGIIVLSLVSAIFLGLIFAGFVMGIKSCNPFLIGCAGTIICGLVASWFSSVAFQSKSSLLLIASALSVVIGGISAALRKTSSRNMHSELSKRVSAMVSNLLRLFLRSAAVWVLLGMMIAGTFSVAGYFALRSRPIVNSINIGGFAGLEVKPRNSTIKGTLFYIGDRDETPSDLLKSTLRPFAQKGWSVVCFEQPEFTSDAQNAMSMIVEEFCRTRLQGNIWSIAGHRRGALIALDVGTRGLPAAISCYMMPIASPLAEPSLLSLVGKVKYPLLLCAQQNDSSRSGVRLERIAPSATTPFLKLEIHDGEFSMSSQHWQLWVDAADRLFSEHR